MEAIVIVMSIVSILHENVKFSQFSIVKLNPLPQSSIMLKHAALTHTELVSEPAAKTLPISAPDRRKGRGITCLSRLTLGPVGPGRVLSPAAFAWSILSFPSIRVTAPKSLTLHLLI